MSVSGVQPPNHPQDAEKSGQEGTQGQERPPAINQLDPLDEQLIDFHFQSSELSRYYSPSGIYRKVQRFIDTELADARKRHDAECEMRDGFRRWCNCAERRGYTYKHLPDGTIEMVPNPLPSAELS